MQAVLNQYAALDTPLTLKDWCSCFLHEPQLLNTEPQVLEQHIKQLGKLFGRHNDELKDVILGCPALLLQDVQQTAEKVSSGLGPHVPLRQVVRPMNTIVGFK